MADPDECWVVIDDAAAVLYSSSNTTEHLASSCVYRLKPRELNGRSRQELPDGEQQHRNKNYLQLCGNKNPCTRKSMRARDKDCSDPTDLLLIYLKTQHR